MNVQNYSKMVKALKKKKIGDVGTLGNIVEQYGSVKLIQAHKGMGGRIR